MQPGRPKKSERDIQSKTEFINAAAKIISKKGTGNITIRDVCNEAGLSIGTFYYFFKDKNDLLMSFIKEPSFENIELNTPLENISERVIELYLILIKRYLNFGRDFVKSFYSPSNKILSAYMSESNGKFEHGTIMERSEFELLKAKEKNFINIPNNISIHERAADICTIVKGCVFEWCLNDNEKILNIENITERIIKNYLSKYI